MTTDGIVWTVEEGAAGGTVTAGGEYTAPPSPGTYHVRAALSTRPEASATATVVVIADGELPRVAVVPAEASVPAGGQLTFVAVVSGLYDSAVTWTVAEGTAGGVVDVAGLYVAPASAGTYHVVATSVADPAVHGTAIVTVPLPGLTVTPDVASVEVGAVRGFEARLPDGQIAPVRWSVAEASGGTVDGHGYFRPPPTPGTYHVVATSLADPNVWGAATVTVVPLVLTLTPAVASVEPGGVLLFDATLPDGSEPKVFWSVEEGAEGGTVNPDGVYTAPLTLGTYHVVATSIWDLTVSVSAEVTVVDAGPNLIDHGGPVFPTAHVYAIWWGDQAALADSKVALETFLQELEGSSYLAIADQYLRGSKAHVQLGGHYQDPTIPAEAYNADIGPKACEAITNEWKEVDPEGIYFVFTSFLLKGAGAAGWHGYDSCNGATYRLVWVSHSDQFIDLCQGLWGSGAAAVGIFSHELFETMTDGGPGRAWWDAEHREIADKCHRECHAVGSRSWYTNALWSNETGTCEPEALPWLPLPPEYGGN